MIRSWTRFWRRHPSKLSVIVPTSAKGEALNAFEYGALVQYQCPDCNADIISGPTGGMSMNVACSGCGSEFNFTPAIGAADRNSTRGEPNLDRLSKIFGILLYQRTALSPTEEAMEARFFDANNRLIARVQIDVGKHAFSQRSALVQKKLNGLVANHPSATMATVERERYIIEDGVTRFNGFVEEVEMKRVRR